MRLFALGIHPRLAERADGSYAWKIPAVDCEVCNEPVGEPSGYPNLDITGAGLDEDMYTLRYPSDPRGGRSRISWDEYDKLKQPLQQLLSPDRPVFPGMGFGPFRGTVKHSEKRDFVWVWPTELLPSASTYERLRQVGIQLPTGPAIIKDRKTGELRTDYRRIIDLRIVDCVATQTQEFATEWSECSKCGLKIGKRPERLFLRGSVVTGRLKLTHLGSDQTDPPWRELV